VQRFGLTCLKPWPSTNDRRRLLKTTSVFQYQPAEGCCVPTAIINCLIATHGQDVVPYSVIRAIYQNSLDEPISRRTSSEAIERIANNIDRIGCNVRSRATGFSCSSQYLLGEQVSLAGSSAISLALGRGGTALLLLCWPNSIKHAVSALKRDSEWVYCFDPRFRRRYLNRPGLEFLGKPGEVRLPNLRIAVDWLDQITPQAFYCLGPIEDREAVVFESS
jgi:hypothetical protein